MDAEQQRVWSDQHRTWSEHCNGGRQDRLDHPVNCVDWPAADAYCRWRGGSLPTEAQWEYAAAGADGRLYPWGNGAPDTSRLNWRDRLNASTAPVGSHSAGASPFGLLDMAGNVREWTSDWEGYFRNGDAYRGGPASNPSGPARGSLRMVRGSGYLTNLPRLVRVIYREGRQPAFRHSDLGFRCAHGGA
jgi:formylglycine-generating enzyme required for sulfatase activity